MKTIEVNIHDYFSEDELREMVRQQFLANVSGLLRSDAERILSNFAHFQAQKIVDELMTEDQKRLVQENTEKVLLQMSPGTVFHRSWYSRDPDSVAQQILNWTVEANRDAIIAKVTDTITGFNFEAALNDDALGILRSAILKKLSHKCEE